MKPKPRLSHSSVKILPKRPPVTQGFGKRSGAVFRAMLAVEKARAMRSKEKYFLRLYVAGASIRSRQALRRVYQLCKSEVPGNYELEIIDGYQQPQLARENQIVVTPTLVKEFPLPVRRFIGNLLNTASLFGEVQQPAPA